MEAAQAPWVRLCYNGGSALLAHQATGEIVCLPGCAAGWGLHFDNAGKGFVTSLAHGSRLLSDIFQHTLIQDGKSSAMFVLTGGSTLVSYKDFVAEGLKEVKAPLLVNGHSAMELHGWWFKRPIGGAFSWWSLASIFEAAGKPFAMTPNEWYHSWWPWWAKILGRLGYPAVHARRASPTKQSSCAADAASSMEFDLRVLPQYSLSAYALLALLPRWCQARSKGSKAKAEKSAQAWSTFMSLLLGTYVVGEKWLFCLRLDCDAQALPGLPIAGSDEVQLPVDTRGRVDVSALKASSHRSAALLLQALPGGDEPTLHQMCLAWCGGKKLEFAFSQLVWHLGSIIETAIKGSLEEVLPVSKASREQLGVRSFSTISKKICKFQRRQRMLQYFLLAGRLSTRTSQLFHVLQMPAEPATGRCCSSPWASHETLQCGRLPWHSASKGYTLVPQPCASSIASSRWLVSALVHELGALAVYGSSSCGAHCKQRIAE
jgi:hypothetical protein